MLFTPFQIYQFLFIYNFYLYFNYISLFEFVKHFAENIFVDIAYRKIYSH